MEFGSQDLRRGSPSNPGMGWVSNPTRSPSFLAKRIKKILKGSNWKYTNFRNCVVKHRMEMISSLYQHSRIGKLKFTIGKLSNRSFDRFFFKLKELKTRATKRVQEKLLEEERRRNLRIQKEKLLFQAKILADKRKLEKAALQEQLKRKALEIASLKKRIEVTKGFPTVTAVFQQPKKVDKSPLFVSEETNKILPLGYQGPSKDFLASEWANSAHNKASVDAYKSLYKKGFTVERSTPSIRKILMLEGYPISLHFFQSPGKYQVKIYDLEFQDVYLGGKEFNKTEFLHFVSKLDEISSSKNLEASPLFEPGDYYDREDRLRF
jgi:hypothetical protein